MISLAAVGCGGGGGGGKTASNSSGSGGQTSDPAPVSPFTPPAAVPPQTPAPDPAPTPAPTTPPTETPPPSETPPAAETPPEAPSAGDGGVTLTWEVPAETNTQGELAGYRIHYGNDAAVLTETIVVDNPGVLSYVVDTLPAGTYYFAVRAVMADGSQSGLSNVIEKQIS